MVAEVIIISNAKDLNRVFDYEVPAQLVGIIKVGSKVSVPFGRYKNLTDAYVIALKEKSNFKLKQLGKIDEQFSITTENMELAKIMSKRYFCNVADAIKLMLPPGTLTKDIRVKEKSRDFVFLKKEIEEIEQDILDKKIKSEKQIKTLRFLFTNDEILASELEIFAETSRAVINTLKKNGYIDIEERQIDRNPFIHKKIKPDSKLTLNEEQKVVYNEVAKCIDKKQFETFLLHGVTGSRKNRGLYAINRKSIATQYKCNNASSRNIANTTNGR